MVERTFGRFWGSGFSEAGSETGIEDREKLLNKAKESIRIVNTNLPSLDSLNKALTQGVTVEVVTIQDHSSYDLLQLTRNGVLLFELKKPPLRKFDIIDGKHVRVEGPDAPGLPSQEQYTVNNYKYSFELLKEFDSLKGKATAHGRNIEGPALAILKK